MVVAQCPPGVLRRAGLCHTEKWNLQGMETATQPDVTFWWEKKAGNVSFFLSFLSFFFLHQSLVHCLPFSLLPPHHVVTFSFPPPFLSILLLRFWQYSWRISTTSECPIRAKVPLLRLRRRNTTKGIVFLDLPDSAPPSLTRPNPFFLLAPPLPTPNPQQRFASSSDTVAYFFLRALHHLLDFSRFRGVDAHQSVSLPSSNHRRDYPDRP